MEENGLLEIVTVGGGMERKVDWIDPGEASYLDLGGDSGGRRLLGVVVAGGEKDWTLRCLCSSMFSLELADLDCPSEPLIFELVRTFFSFCFSLSKILSSMYIMSSSIVSYILSEINNLKQRITHQGPTL